MGSLLESFRDARGDVRDLLPRNAAAWYPRVGGALPGAVQRRLFFKLYLGAGSAGRAPRRWPRLDRGMFVVMVAAGLVFAGKWIAVLTGSAVSQMVVGESIVHLLLITPVVYFAVRAAQRLMVRRPNQLFAEAIAAEGYCPGCGYALAGQRVQGDGCTVCPECGCAVRAGSV